MPHQARSAALTGLPCSSSISVHNSGAMNGSWDLVIGRLKDPWRALAADLEHDYLYQRLVATCAIRPCLSYARLGREGRAGSRVNRHGIHHPISA